MTTGAQCSLTGCSSPLFGRGFCQRHRRHFLEGRELSAKQIKHSRFSAEEFWARVNKSDGCWEWNAAMTQAGYGKVRMPNGKTGTAHRRSYEIANGPVPDGLVLDHLCRNTKCVRPEHLEAVTMQENTRRGLSSMDFTGRCMADLHDIRSESDTITFTAGKRMCRACWSENGRRRRDIVTRARKHLGLTVREYADKHGHGYKVALELLGETP